MQSNVKKILLSLGVVTLPIIPLITIASCSTNNVFNMTGYFEIENKVNEIIFGNSENKSIEKFNKFFTKSETLITQDVVALNVVQSLTNIRLNISDLQKMLYNPESTFIEPSLFINSLNELAKNTPSLEGYSFIIKLTGDIANPINKMYLINSQGNYSVGTIDITSKLFFNSEDLAEYQNKTNYKYKGKTYNELSKEESKIEKKKMLSVNHSLTQGRNIRTYQQTQYIKLGLLKDVNLIGNYINSKGVVEDVTPRITFNNRLLLEQVNLDELSTAAKELDDFQVNNFDELMVYANDTWVENPKASKPFLKNLVRLQERYTKIKDKYTFGITKELIQFTKSSIMISTNLKTQKEWDDLLTLQDKINSLKFDPIIPINIIKNISAVFSANGWTFTIEWDLFTRKSEGDKEVTNGLTLFKENTLAAIDFLPTIGTLI